MENGDMTDLINGIQQIFTDFHSAWYLGSAAVCYLLIQFFRGKFNITVPWVTNKLESLSKEVKTGVILGLFGLAGVFMGFAKSPVTVGSVVSSLLGGITLGLTTIGARNVTKQTLESVQARKELNSQNKDETK